MRREDVEAQAQAFERCLLALEQAGLRALPAMVGLFAENARLSNSALRRRGMDHRGREGVEQFWRHYLELLGSGRTAFSHTTVSETAAGLFWKTTLPAGGGEYVGVTLLVFDDDGRIGSMEGIYDPDAVRTVLTRTVHR